MHLQLTVPWEHEIQLPWAVEREKKMNCQIKGKWVKLHPCKGPHHPTCLIFLTTLWSTLSFILNHLFGSGYWWHPIKKSGCYWFIVHSQREILKRIRVCLMEKSNFLYSCNGSYLWSGMTHQSGSLSIHKGQVWPIYLPMNFHEAFISWTRRFLQIGYGPKQRWIQI